MAKQTINVGSSANDGTGDKIRVAFQKCNSNFDELYDAVAPANLISTDADNSIVLGTDNKLWSGGGGGSVGTLQQVTDNGNTITSGDYVALFEAGVVEITNQNTGTSTIISADEGVSIKTDAFQGKVKSDDLTLARVYQLPDASGTIALTSNIPTVDATPTDGSSNAVSSNGVFDALVLKQDVLTETNFGSFMNARTAKNTLVDADEVVSGDSADSNKAKKTTWLNVWTNYLKPKADALYQAILTDVTFGTFSTALTDKTTPVDSDTVNLVDSADSNKAKKTTWLNVWTNYLKVKADLLYQPIFSYVPIKIIVADYVNSSGVTGTNSETLISSYKINANTLSALDFMNITLRLLKTGTTAGYLITIRIGTTSTFSTSLTQIAQYGNTLSAGVDVNFQRYFKIEGGSLKSSNFTYNILANQGVSVNSAESSTSFNVSVDNWIFISVKPQSNNSDVITQSIFKITN